MLSTDCNSHFCQILPHSATETLSERVRESSGVDGGRNSNAGSDQAQLFPTPAFSQDRALARALDLFVSHPPSLFPPPCVLRKTMGNVNPGQRALQAEHWTLPQWREGGGLASRRALWWNPYMVRGGVGQCDSKAGHEGGAV